MDVQLELKKYEGILTKGQRYAPFAKNWNSEFPEEGGVYVLWDADDAVYVGETSCIKCRMADLSRPVNHPFPRKVAKFVLASQLPLESLRIAISNRYKVSFCVALFGRAEIEEYLILRWRQTLMNKPTKRLLQGTQYNWMKAES